MYIKDASKFRVFNKDFIRCQTINCIEFFVLFTVWFSYSALISRFVWFLQWKTSKSRGIPVCKEEISYCCKLLCRRHAIDLVDQSDGLSYAVWALATTVLTGSNDGIGLDTAAGSTTLFTIWTIVQSDSIVYVAFYTYAGIGRLSQYCQTRDCNPFKVRAFEKI